MSVASSEFTNISSLLKKTSVRSEITKENNKICIQLPKNIDNILTDFKSANKIEYKRLIYLFHEGIIKDSDLSGFILNMRSYICHLSIEHELFIEALLQIRWIEKSSEVIYNYKLFLQDLISIQTCHIKTVIYHLVEFFKPNKILTSENHSDAKYEIDPFQVEDMEKLNHVHDTLRIILKTVPMSDVYLVQAIESKFPYAIQDSFVHQTYIYMLLKMMEYIAPKRRLDILSLIIQKLMTLDITMPQKKVYNKNEEEDKEENDDNEEEDDTDIEMANGDDTSTVNDNKDKTNDVNPIMHTLDVCMEVFFKYMREFCFTNGVLQIESLRILYVDILRIFETIILPTQAARCVQYIMFYICSFKPIVAEMFIDWLWRKTNNPNLSIIVRKSAVYYISSLCANASFITSELVELTMSKLIDWIHDYITRHEYAEYLDKKAHIIFYAICRAFLHLFIMRHKEFISSINGILFLQELDIPRIINCKLNPLQMCESQIVQNFAEITNAYQLAYCYTVVENNQRSELSILDVGQYEFVSLINVLPFEFYALEHSGQKIVPLVRYNDANRYSLINRHY